MIFLSSKTLTRPRTLLWKDQGVNSQYLWWWWSYSCQTLLATGLWWDCELFWSRLVRLSLICFENCVFWHLFSRSGWQLRHDYNTWGERIAGPRGGYVAASQVVPRHWPGGGSRSQNTTNILNTSTVWISNVSVSADHVCLVRCQKKWSGGWKWERYLGNGGSSLTPLRPPRWSCLIRRTCLGEEKHSENLDRSTFDRNIHKI